MKAIARQESTCKHFRKSGYSQSIKKVLFFDENELLQNSDEESHDEESESSDEENDENADSLNNEGYRIARGCKLYLINKIISLKPIFFRDGIGKKEVI